MFRIRVWYTICKALIAKSVVMLPAPASLILPIHGTKQRFREWNFFVNEASRSLEGEEQRQRPPPVAETGSCCWGRGLQDASAVQGTKQMQGAATRICRMTLSETMLLLTLLATVAALLVDVAKAAFDIAWKISHDRRNDKNKKD